MTQTTIIELPQLLRMPVGITAENVFTVCDEGKDYRCQYYSNSLCAFVRIGEALPLDKDTNAVIAAYAMKDSNKALSLRCLQYAIRWASVSAKLNYMSEVLPMYVRTESEQDVAKVNTWLDTLKAGAKYSLHKANQHLGFHFLNIPTYMEGVKYAYQKEWATECKEKGGTALEYRAHNKAWEQQQAVILLNAYGLSDLSHLQYEPSNG
jgi:hypothetical protein